MPKARSVDIDDMMTPEQRSEGQEMADLYFLAFPRQTLEELNKVAKGRNMTLAQALSVAIANWIQND